MSQAQVRIGPFLLALLLTLVALPPTASGQKVEAVMKDLTRRTQDVPKLIKAVDAAYKAVYPALDSFDKATGPQIAVETQKTLRAMDQLASQFTVLRVNLEEINRSFSQWDLVKGQGTGETDKAAGIEVKSALASAEILVRQVRAQTDALFSVGGAEWAKTSKILAEMMAERFERMAAQEKRAKVAMAEVKRIRSDADPEGFADLRALMRVGEAQVNLAETVLSLARVSFLIYAIQRAESSDVQDTLDSIIGKDAKSLRLAATELNLAPARMNSLLARLFMGFDPAAPGVVLTPEQSAALSDAIRRSEAECQEGYEMCHAQCSDGVSNDDDSLVDCDDPDCSAACLTAGRL